MSPFKAPRGTTDILPEEQPYWHWIRQKAEELCHCYGYQPVETPIFEEAGLFVRTIGPGTDIVEKEMYIFKDRGDKQLTLKPEGTASVCRAYLEHGMGNLPQPVRLYYFSPLFRYERPQAGRYRQHHQIGVEAIGDDDPALDAEVIDLAWSLYRALGLQGLSLQFNSLGCRGCRPAYRAALVDFYSSHLSSLCPDCQARFQRNPLRLLDCKNPTCQEIAQGAPRTLDFLCPDCRRHFDGVVGCLELWSIPYQLNHRLVRGLDYYNRTVFEVQPPEEGAQATLGGGGRYDDLMAELGGRPTPAVGFATGIERIVVNLKRQGITPPPLPLPRAYIGYLPEARQEALRLLGRLRQEGVGAIASSEGRGLKGQLRQADALGIPFALLLGGEEVAAGVVTLREMASGQQERLTLDQLLARLKAQPVPHRDA